MHGDIDEDEIDWVNEDLVGTAFAQAGCGFDVTVDTVEWLIDPNVVRINVFEEATGSCEQQLLKWVFLLVEDAPEGARLAQGPMAERMLSDRNFDKVEQLGEFAQRQGHTLLELAFGWLASMPAVASVIAGATKPEQVEANVAAGSWRLTEEELAEVDGITKH